jgi:hypothetical protein
MKTKQLTNDTVFAIAGTSGNPGNPPVAFKVYADRHAYMIPYERNDEYLKLANQENARNPETNLEPEYGMMLYADIDFEYNYYSPKWQEMGDLITSANQQSYWSAGLLPSLNLFLMSGSGLQFNGSLSTEQLYDLQFGIYEYSSQFPLSATRFPIEHALSKEYFEASYESLLMMLEHAGNNPSHILAQTYGDKIQAGVDGEYPGMSYPTTGKPEFINLDMANLYSDLDNKREMFPYFSKLKLAGVQKNGFCTMLEAHGLVDEFIDFLVVKRTIPNPDIEYNELPLSINLGSSSAPTKHDIYAYKLNDFLSHVQNSALGANITQFAQSQSSCSTIEAYINQIIFGSQLEQYLTGAPKDEPFPVAFRLEKYLTDDPRNTDQSLGEVSIHYFFNYDDLSEFLFFDTQISYRTTYTYRIKVINAIVQEKSGFAYVHNTPQPGDTFYYMYFLEEPYYSEAIHVLDSPPIAPDVELLTYRGIDNKILILFNQMIDKEVRVPIYINESDTQSFEEQYTAQKIQPPKPLIFESDDPVDFELFRTSEKPYSYSDFANINYKLINSNQGTSAAYEDNIVPNQYYYYTFRAQDYNGFVSNPTPVYEFILIKEGETMYPRIRIVDFKKPDPPAQKNRTFKKYLKIGFSPRQYTLSDAIVASVNDGLVGSNISIGTADDKLIGSNREFKFRIRSKNTGKLIDINVTFKKNNVNRA